MFFVPMYVVCLRIEPLFFGPGQRPVGASSCNSRTHIVQKTSRDRIHGEEITPRSLQVPKIIILALSPWLKVPCPLRLRPRLNQSSNGKYPHPPRP